MKTTPLLLALLVLLLGMSGRASAQDARWAPWLGCWDRVTERLGATSVDGSARAEFDTVRPDADAPEVCVEPAGENAVRLTTSVPGQDPIVQTLTADGKPHPIDENGCEGTEIIEWSQTGRRLFARADVTCAGGERRAISGLALIAPDGSWLDIRSVQLDDVATTRVSRYRRTTAPADDSDASAGLPLTLAEIKEAGGKVTGAVLEAAIVETNPRLPVRAATLLELADAGVPPRVIDVIVALANPDRFIVERTGQVASVESSTSTSYGIDDYYATGFFYPAYYYSPFSYGYLGFYDPFLFGRGYYLPSRPIGGVPPRDDRPVASERARAIQGQGYTRIRPAGEAQETTGRIAQPRPPGRSGSTGSSSGGRVSSSGSSGSSGSSSSGSSGGSSGSSGGSASPGGFSSGGGSTGRTAQPR